MPFFSAIDRSRNKKKKTFASAESWCYLLGLGRIKTFCIYIFNQIAAQNNERIAQEEKERK